jgi:putative spermidine/putrescine transport system ATP-binding protein
LTTAVRFKNVSLHYGNSRALEGVDLEIVEGEFFGILGPSGSGKTSCLRLIAGFEQPNAGTLELHGKSAAKIPPYERDVNTVFQDYALFPHMNVEQNVAYGLMVRRVGRRERRERVAEMLETVQLRGFENRRPGELSGGQRQRVALARALINRPSMLLLDEPLGALDLKLRQQMQIELRSLQRRLGITFIFVTHDQGEALSMSDRLAVFNRGRIEQVGTPREIYERPATRFAAEFVGDSNLVELRGDDATPTGEQGLFSLRPENVRVATAPPEPNAGMLGVAGTVTDVQFHGASVRYVVALDDDSTMTAVEDNRRLPEGGSLGVGAEIWLVWSPQDMHHLGDGNDV